MQNDVRRLFAACLALGAGAILPPGALARDTSPRGHAIPVRPSQNLPARNGPCPCGSGRKYKSCGRVGACVDDPAAAARVRVMEMGG